MAVEAMDEVSHESGGSRTEVYAEIGRDADEATNALRSRVERDESLAERLKELEAEAEEIAVIENEAERDTRTRVLNATLNELRREAQTEADELGTAVFGLDAIIEGLGEEYQTLDQYSQSEQNLIDTAQAAVDAVNAKLGDLESAWFFKSSRTEVAQLELETAETGLETATTKANQLRRQRLMSADMEASLQEIQRRANQIIDIIEQRIEQVNDQLRTVSMRKAEAFEAKEAAARDLERHDAELDQLEAELQSAEEELTTYINGTEAYTAQEQKISGLRAEGGRIRGERNASLAVFQSKEKFVTEHEVHERTQQKLYANLTTWRRALRSDTEERIVTFKSRLEAMKAMSDQDIARNLDELGSAVDQKNAEYMATAGAVSDRIMMEKIEKHPERMAEMERVVAAQAEATQDIRMRMAEQLQNFRDKYGIDPLQSSYFSYEGSEKGAQQPIE